MGGNRHGGIRVVVADDGAQDIVPGCRIHAANGLIQQVELCLPAHHQDQLHLFLVSLGEILELIAGGDIEMIEHFQGTLLPEVTVKLPEELHQNQPTRIQLLRYS